MSHTENHADCPGCFALIAPLRASIRARDWAAFERAECALFDHFAPGVYSLPKAEGLLPPHVARTLRALCAQMLRAFFPMREGV